jgi:hypothetical protein
VPAEREETGTVAAEEDVESGVIARAQQRDQAYVRLQAKQRRPPAEDPDPRACCETGFHLVLAGTP